MPDAFPLSKIELLLWTEVNCGDSSIEIEGSRVRANAS